MYLVCLRGAVPRGQRRLRYHRLYVAHDSHHGARSDFRCQRGVVARAHHRDEVIANINTLVERARAEDVPVIWVQHSDDGLASGEHPGALGDCPLHALLHHL